MVSRYLSTLNSAWYIIFYAIMLQEFSKKLIAFENIISSASIGDGLTMRQFMGFEKEYKHLGRLAPALQANPKVSFTSLPSRSKSLLSMLLLAYRTIDIAASLESHPKLSITYERAGGFGECNEVRNIYLFFHQT